jgi:hypothetical protein
MSCKLIDPSCNRPDAIALAKQMFPDDFLLVGTHHGKDMVSNVAASQQAFAARIIQTMIDAGWRHYWGRDENVKLPVLSVPRNPTPPDWWATPAGKEEGK